MGTDFLCSGFTPKWPESRTVQFLFEYELRSAHITHCDQCETENRSCVLLPDKSLRDQERRKALVRDPITDIRSTSLFFTVFTYVSINKLISFY